MTNDQQCTLATSFSRIVRKCYIMFTFGPNFFPFGKAPNVKRLPKFAIC